VDAGSNAEEDGPNRMKSPFSRIFSEFFPFCCQENEKQKLGAHPTEADQLIDFDYSVRIFKNIKCSEKHHSKGHSKRLFKRSPIDGAYLIELLDQPHTKWVNGLEEWHLIVGRFSETRSLFSGDHRRHD
jgi:hypothetical protein